MVGWYIIYLQQGREQKRKESNMTLIEMYKNISRTVDYHIKIIEYLKIKNNKSLAKHFYTAIISLINNYYRFTGLKIKAKNYFMNRIAKNTEWLFK